MTDYANHPASELFPMMTDDEMSKLTLDIKEHGLLEPIVLHEMKVLDGRNRQIACAKANVPPRYVEWRGEHESPTQYVLAKNLHRRQLSKSQCALIAADAMPLLKKEAMERMEIGRPRQANYPPVALPEDSSVAKSQRTKGDARDIAAKALGVGGSIVSRALAVKKADPIETERIRKGHTTVEEAYRKVRGGQPSKRREQREKAHGRTLTEILSGIRGALRNLEGLNVNLALSGMEPKEIRFWGKQAFSLATQLRRLGSKIKGHKEVKHVR